MRSHSYQFSARDLLGQFAAPILLCVVFAVAIHVGAITGMLPAPKPILDVDRTILLHQVEVSRNPSSAEVVLIGDSSCLMDVNARQLEQLVGKPVLNLATLSYVTLDDHARLLRNYFSTNSSVKTVVLLMHPESLRLASRNSYFSEVLNAYLSGRDHFANEPKVLQFAGASIFRSRILTHGLPVPLPGAYGRHYGFNQNLWNYLTAHNGSALDPHTYATTAPSGNPEYRLAPQLEPASARFRSALPAGVRLIVGITPSPADYVLRNHAANTRVMLDTWSQWLEAETVLNTVPTILPREHFATPTHLNVAGVSKYTESLANALLQRAR